jgi:chemotaxis protein methyltransferase CheR
VPAELLSMNVRDFNVFRTLIHRETGIWLRDGKQAMLASRLSRRLRHHGMSDFASYFAYVEQVGDGGQELNELINCVTTNKTSFFREVHHFEFLADTLVPTALAAALRGEPRALRIWSAACSTGEEPYSIAITLLEAIEAGRSVRPASAGLAGASSAGSWEIEVVASDIDTAVLATAAQGVYGEASLESVPPTLQTKYFLRGKGDMLGRVRLKAAVANLIKFQRINLMDSSWPLDSKFDAIFFRNALIYFNRDTQELFLRKMLRHLKPGGYLLLGHSEHVPWLHDAVLPLNRTIYQLRPGGSQPHAPVSSRAVSRPAVPRKG